MAQRSQPQTRSPWELRFNVNFEGTQAFSLAKVAQRYQDDVIEIYVEG